MRCSTELQAANLKWPIHATTFFNNYLPCTTEIEPRMVEQMYILDKKAKARNFNADLEIIILTFCEYLYF